MYRISYLLAAFFFSQLMFVVQVKYVLASTRINGLKSARSVETVSFLEASSRRGRMMDDWKAQVNACF